MSNRDNNRDQNKDRRSRRQEGRGDIKSSPSSKSHNDQQTPKVLLTSPQKVLSKNPDLPKDPNKPVQLFGVASNSSPTPAIKDQQSPQQIQVQSQVSNVVFQQTESIKIINKTLKLNKSGIESLHRVLKDNDNFLVVGCVGAQSSGKSTILSALSVKNNNNVPFEIQSENNFCLGNHQTDGVEVYVDSRDRIIYIDTQPLDSISILCELIEKSVHIPNNIVSYEHYHHLQSLRIVMFLMSICNVLLVVQENKALDLSICKLIRASMMLKNKLPDISQPNLNPSQLTNSFLDSDQFEFKSKLICIFNKLNELDYDMRPLDKTMAYLFTNPKDNHQIHPSSPNINLITNIDCFQIPEKKHAPSSTSLSSSNNNNPTPNITPKENNSPIPSTPSTSSSSSVSNLQLLNSIPLLSPYKYYPLFNDSIDKLKHQIILLKSSSKFNKPIKETEWLDNAVKIWDTIQNSDILESYSKHIKSLFSIGLSK